MSSPVCGVDIRRLLLTQRSEIDFRMQMRKYVSIRHHPAFLGLFFFPPPLPPYFDVNNLMTAGKGEERDHPRKKGVKEPHDAVDPRYNHVSGQEIISSLADPADLCALTAFYSSSSS